MQAETGNLRGCVPAKIVCRMCKKELQIVFHGLNRRMQVDGNEVKLEVTYSIPNIESGTNTFSELFGGRHDTTKEQAVAAVLEAVKGWANEMRARFPDVSVWDDNGKHY